MDFSLGVFRKFGSQDLLALISDLRRNKKKRTLNLSNSSTIDAAGLRKILQITPELQNLYLMNTPSLSIRSVLSLPRESSLSIAELYHPDLFRLYMFGHYPPTSFIHFAMVLITALQCERRIPSQSQIITRHDHQLAHPEISS